MDTPYETIINIYSHASVPWQQKILDSFLKKIIIYNDAFCIDVGTGIGNNLSTLLKYCRKIIAVDISERALRILKRRYRKNLNQLQIRKMDAHHLNYPSKTFDLVVCTEVLEHCFKPEKVFNECIRILKPGGYVIFSCPNYFNLAGIVKIIWENIYPQKIWDAWGNHSGGIENFFTSLKLKRWVKNSKLKIVDDCGGDLIRSWLPFFKRHYKIIDRHPYLVVGKYWPLKMMMMNYFVLARKPIN